MSGFNDAANPVFDAGNLKPMRTRTFRDVEDGRPVTRTERRPQGRYLMVVDSAGNIVPLKLHNAISEQAQHDPYKLHIQWSKAQRNAAWGTDPMIPVGICPQQTEHQFKLPDGLQTGTACVKDHSGHHPIGEDSRTGELRMCKCVKKLVDDRRARNKEVEDARDPKTTIMQAVLNNSQEQTAQLTSLLKNLVDSGMVGGDKPAQSPAPARTGGEAKAK